MKRSERLKTVVDVAAIKSDKAGKELQDSRRQHNEQQQQLDQLLQFQEEYKQRLEALGENGVDARQLQNYRRFLHQLGSAVDQQLSILASADQQLNQQQQLWLSQYHRKNTLDSVFQESVKQERQVQDKLEQRETDERAMGSFSEDWH